MLGRIAVATSRRSTALASNACSSGGPRQQAVRSVTSSLLVCGRHNSSDHGSKTGAQAARIAASGAAGNADVVVPPSRTRRVSFSSSSAAAAVVAEEAASLTTTASPKLVYGIPKENDDVVRTPPMEEQDSGPVIREMRVKLRPPSEQGSRGARRIRRAGKVPGVVYSTNDAGAKQGEPLLVKVDKIVLDREIRRLGASFDNTVYELVVTGESQPEGAQDDQGIDITVQDPAVGQPQASAGGPAGGESSEEGGGGVQPEKEHRELVIANQSTLHPVFRTLLSVNWIRYKAGRKYPVPIKFINHDLNDNFRKGAYIRRRGLKAKTKNGPRALLKTRQNILLPDDPDKVPKWLYLDLEFVRSGNKLRVSDIMMPEGIRLHRGAESSKRKYLSRLRNRFLGCDPPVSSSISRAGTHTRPLPVQQSHVLAGCVDG
ncbi:unnamed protein product [Pylaiella littoralis]